MDECRRLQGLPRRLICQPCRSKFTQLVIDQGEQLIGRHPLSPGGRIEQPGNHTVIRPFERRGRPIVARLVSHVASPIQVR